MEEAAAAVAEIAARLRSERNSPEADTRDTDQGFADALTQMPAPSDDDRLIATAKTNFLAGLRAAVRLLQEADENRLDDLIRAHDTEIGPATAAYLRQQIAEVSAGMEEA